MLRLAESAFDDEALDAVIDVLRSGRLTQGPWVERFEESVAAYCGGDFGVATSSGTGALHLTIAALGIGPGDEVIVPDLTHPATGNVVLQQGAQLRLVDVDPATYDVDPEAVRAALTPRTALVIAVDLFGLPADYESIEAMAASHGIPVLADAACSLGGGSGDRSCGQFGVASCFSFHPRKVLTTGEGGMVVTDDTTLAERMRGMRNHGGVPHGAVFSFTDPGFNYRLTEMQAALGVHELRRHDEAVGVRNELASALSSGLADLEGIRPQYVPGGRRSTFQAYVGLLATEIDRDAMIAHLWAHEIEATIGTYALHAEPAFMAACDTKPGDLPSSWDVSRRALALPLHQGLTFEDIETIVSGVGAAIDASRRA